MVASTPWDKIGGHGGLSFLLKLTLMIGALWLAWPDLVRIGRRLPPKFVLIASLSLFVTLVQPRFGLLLVALSLVYWVGWWLYKQAFPSGISLRNPRD
jgi:hypothetical protein